LEGRKGKLWTIRFEILKESTPGLYNHIILFKPGGKGEKGKGERDPNTTKTAHSLFNPSITKGKGGKGSLVRALYLVHNPPTRWPVVITR